MPPTMIPFRYVHSASCLVMPTVRGRDAFLWFIPVIDARNAPEALSAKNTVTYDETRERGTLSL